MGERVIDPKAANAGCRESWQSRAPHETLGPGSRAGMDGVCDHHCLGPRSRWKRAFGTTPG